MEQIRTSRTLPDLSRKTAVVTGAGRDIGRMIIERLSEHGANVYAISRDEIPTHGLRDNVEPMRMNPTRMESIQRGADRIREEVDHVDILVHAASVSIAPRFRSAEGHELMLATNYLGFVMLAHALAPAMRLSESPRIVLADTGRPIDVDIDLERLDADLDLPWDVAYAHSRLAAMMFALELSNRATANRLSLVPVMGEARERAMDAHHPVRRTYHRVMDRVTRTPPDAPANPLIYASTSTEARSGGYYAPYRRGRLRVDQIADRLPPHAATQASRNELWERTEHMLGVKLAIA
jgi:NAD(P)-dependent dehydrogenase (short-subunit alcohol dehydrogenase family)